MKYSFLWFIDKEKDKKLIDFSFPKREWDLLVFFSFDLCVCERQREKGGPHCVCVCEQVCGWKDVREKKWAHCDCSLCMCVRVRVNECV